MKEKSLDFYNKDQLNNQLENLLEKIDETELILIKCHLLVEFSMNAAIANVSYQRKDIDGDKFTFSQKIKICKILGLLDDDEILRFLLNLNKLRNQIAHTLSYDKLLLEKVCLYRDDADKESFIKNQLKTLSLFNSGRIVGRSEILAESRAS